MRGFESLHPSHYLFFYSTNPSLASAAAAQMNHRLYSLLLIDRSTHAQYPQGNFPCPKMMVFAGNSNPDLVHKVVNHLHIPIGKAYVGRFSDGECAVEIQENVRGRDVFIIQSTCAPTNDNLMELLVMADAMRRSSALRVTAVLPYFGYARQDRRPRSSRVPISAKVVADMVAGVGIDRVLTVDLHADQIQGFFDIPVDKRFTARPILLDDIERRDYSDVMVVSPDHGGVVRARAVAKRLNSDLAIIDKRRPKANKSEVMNIIGDVAGRTCILVDDMVDTAGTLCQAAAALKEKGAKAVYALLYSPDFIRTCPGECGQLSIG